MGQREARKRRFMGDFETTVYEGQTYTEVWASAIVELGTEDVHILHSIGETLEFLENVGSDLIIYYHNLKFDGAFWVSYLLTQAGFTQATIGNEESLEDFKFQRISDMVNGTFLYSISDVGQWYRIVIKSHGHTIEIRDSLKLLPFSHQNSTPWLSRHI